MQLIFLGIIVVPRIKIALAKTRIVQARTKIARRAKIDTDTVP